MDNKTSFSTNSFRRHNQLVERLAPWDMDSVYVELSLNMTTFARPSLAKALIKEFNSVSGSSSNGRIKASNPHRMLFMCAELVGRFRNRKISSNYARRASKIDDNVPKIRNLFNRSSNNKATCVPARPWWAFTLSVL